MYDTLKKYDKKMKEFWTNSHLKIYKRFLKTIGFTKNTSRSLFRLFQVALYMACIVFIINVLAGDFNKMGEWGDFFGGVLNPILTFLTFMGLLITIIIQQKELKESRKEFNGQKIALEKQQEEMTIQSFDNKFFQMLNTFNKTTDSLNGKINSVECQGKKVFKELIIILKKEIQHRLSMSQYEKKPDVNKIVYFFEVFDSFNNSYDTTFKYYFINLYQLIKFIDNDIPYKGSEKNKYAKKYTNIIRAQLSKNELVLLAYNAIGIIEFCGDDYKKLIEKYSFFEHLRYDDFNNEAYILSIVNSILIQYESEAFGKNDAIIKQIEKISKEVEDPQYQRALSRKEIKKLIKTRKDEEE